MLKKLLKTLLPVFHLLPAGVKLYLRSFKKQEFELYELYWLVAKGSLAVDIGANNGAYTFALSRLVGRDGRIVAIEPIEHLADYLRRASRQLHLPVDVKQICLSSRDGYADLVIPLSSKGELLTGYANLGNHEAVSDSTHCKQHVKLKRLDDVLADRNRRVSFIKCDVEGHELEVFKGALDILKTDRPNLLVEIEQRHLNEPIDTVLSFFESQCYRGYFFDQNNKLKEVCEFDVSRHQTSPLESSGDKYIYNFIFLPMESPSDKDLR